jgi:hypothetical protein
MMKASHGCSTCAVFVYAFVYLLKDNHCKNQVVSGLFQLMLMERQDLN